MELIRTGTEVEEFCQSPDCRRQMLLKHFGDPNQSAAQRSRVGMVRMRFLTGFRDLKREFKMMCGWFEPYSSSTYKPFSMRNGARTGCCGHPTAAQAERRPEWCCDRCAACSGRSLKGLELLRRGGSRLFGSRSGFWEGFSMLAIAAMCFGRTLDSEAGRGARSEV